ncbi:redoxin domain-containing protein [Algoriphagus sp. D3-2-R+10]|uniref:TlpA family protein disulfide reductase n=1 Tax=Algoriphagus aurantiacus TaxID=3103948 RepID=UPI002B36AF6C|nr:redoxin domain-containing protein [Algoriphagus sp. D3-2-R+10]MEB2776643.1 redoxin domain-containing protein [Algoriphagus sp. D3-2-R+10]
MKKVTLVGLVLLVSYSISIAQSYNLSNPDELEECIQIHKKTTLGLPVGSEFPKFDYLDIEGKKTEYKDLKEKLIILNTWFVGCTGCKQEEENLQKLTEEFKDRDDIEFLSFAMSSPQKIERYFSKRGDFGYKTASVDRKWVDENFKIELSPTHYIIKDGILVELISMPFVSPQLLEWYRNRILGFLAES